jgi:hypothetical protein
MIARGSTVSSGQDVAYATPSDAAPRAERDALTANYWFVLSVHQANRKVAETDGEKDPKYWRGGEAGMT